MATIVSSAHSDELRDEVAEVNSTQFELRPRLSADPLPLDNFQDVVICRPMLLEDYPCVRALIPQVSRCSQFYSKDIVAMMLELPTFFPFVMENSATRTIVGYAELHRLPHLGRGFDCRLEKVIVVESMRGLKLAQKACAYLLEIAKTKLQCGRVDLTVEKPDAKKVYSNLGFVKVETEVWRLML